MQRLERSFEKNGCPTLPGTILVEADQRKTERPEPTCVPVSMDRSGAGMAGSKQPDPKTGAGRDGEASDHKHVPETVESPGAKSVNVYEADNTLV